MDGILYLVATPIGNLKDITIRAIEVLESVDYIACEDTRHSQILLKEYNISKPLFSYYKEKEQKASEKIIQDLKNGKNIALITDAGMPCISDPGSILVNKIHKEKLNVKVIPGPCALVSAYALSGSLSKGFCFLGFLPEKEKEIEELLNSIDIKNMSLVFYVAPHDIKNTLKKIYSYLGDKQITLVKEMTKIYETIIKGKISEVLEEVDKVKGEFVLIIENKEENIVLEDDPEKLLKLYITLGIDSKTAIKRVSRELKLPKDVVYKIYLKLTKA